MSLSHTHTQLGIHSHFPPIFLFFSFFSLLLVLSRYFIRRILDISLARESWPNKMSVFDWICPPFFFLFFFLVFLLDFSLTPRSRNLFLTRIYIDACCNVGAIKEECYGSTATYWTFSIILWSMFLLVKEYKNYFLKKKKKPQDYVSQPERHSSGGPWACVFAIYSLDLLWFFTFFFSFLLFLDRADVVFSSFQKSNVRRRPMYWEGGGTHSHVARGLPETR